MIKNYKERYILFNINFKIYIYYILYIMAKKIFSHMEFIILKYLLDDILKTKLKK